MLLEADPELPNSLHIDVKWIVDVLTLGPWKTPTISSLLFAYSPRSMVQTLQGEGHLHPNATEQCGVEISHPVAQRRNQALLVTGRSCRSRVLRVANGRREVNL